MFGIVGNLKKRKLDPQITQITQITVRLLNAAGELK